MTTYNGKSSQFGVGKSNPNREPLTSVVFIERQYRVHREKLQEIQPMVDDRVVIPSFFKKKSWKKHQLKVHDDEIAVLNEGIYKRLVEVEAKDSVIASDAKEHVKIVDSQIKYFKNINDYGRQKKLLKIQKENENLLKRIERTKPAYTLKSCQDWYKHHIRFKQGRRFDPTAGHILRCASSLLPKPLPPLEKSKNSLQSASNSVLETSSRVSQSKRQGGQSQSKDTPTLLSAMLEPISVLSQCGATITSTQVNRSRLSSLPYGHTNQRIGRAGWSSSSTGQTMRSVNGLKTNSIYRSKFGIAFDNSDDETAASEASNSLHKLMEDVAHKKASIVPFQNNLNSRSNGTLNYLNRDPSSQDEENSLNSFESGPTADSKLEFENDKMILETRPFAVPFDQKNCIVQICAMKEIYDNLFIRVLSTSHPPKVYSEISLLIDSVEQMVEEATTTSSMINQVTNHEDIQALRSLLIKMFNEEDTQHVGYLTFDQFQKLMEKINFGISSQELRFVISEADENENGVIDYNEFVPLAADLIQSFRARSKAKTMLLEEDILVDDQILSSLARDEIKAISSICLEKIREVDNKRYGVIRPIELKKCLANMNSLSENEIIMICQLLPRDGFGRCSYDHFEEVLTHVRFLTLKSAVIEAHGSDLQKYLLDICKEEECKLHMIDSSAILPMDNANTNASSTTPMANTAEILASQGLLPVRSLINILYNAPRLTLSRLQVLVIMAEAKVLDGMINYYQFIPMVAKTIEIMFEPKALRQRAELIEKTSYSSDILLSGVYGEIFEQKLLTLFKSFDVDHSGYIDENEFIACLAALDFQLTKGEIIQLMGKASFNNIGALKFDEFLGFFTNNLTQLEKEKHMRILYSKIHISELKPSSILSSGAMMSTPKGFVPRGPILDAPTTSITYQTDLMFQNISCSTLTSYHTRPAATLSFNRDIIRKSENNSFNGENFQQHLSVDYDNNATVEGLIPHIAAIFKITDKFSTGFLSLKEIADILLSLDIKISSNELKMLVEDIERDNHGNIDYKAFTPVCAELLETFRAFTIATEARLEKERWASNKADKIIASTTNELQNIARYIKDRFHLVQDTVTDVSNRATSLQEILRNPHSGLNKSEVSLVMAKLYVSPSQSPSKASRPASRMNAQSPNRRSSMHSPITSSSKLLQNSNPIINDFMNTTGLVAKGNTSEATPSEGLTLSTNSVKLSRQYSAVVTMTPSHEKESGTVLFSAPLSPMKHTASGYDSCILRSDISLSELTDILTEIRKQSIMKSLLEDLHPNEIRSKLLKNLIKEAKQLKQLGLMEEDSNYLPVTICYKVLENIRNIKIHRAKIIAIISWTNCYDSTGLLLHYQRFADQTADVLSRLQDSHFMELFYNQPQQSAATAAGHGYNQLRRHSSSQESSSRRPSTQSLLNLETKLFNNMRESDITAYLSTSFIKIENNSHQIVQEDFLQVLKHIPRLHLSDQDTMNVLLSLPSTVLTSPTANSSNPMNNGASNGNNGSNSNSASRSNSRQSRSRQMGSRAASRDSKSRNSSQVRASLSSQGSRANTAHGMTPTIAESPSISSNSSVSSQSSTIRMKSRGKGSSQSSVAKAIAATAAAVNSSKPNVSEHSIIIWKEFLPVSYDILRTVLKERQQQRERYIRSSSTFHIPSVDETEFPSFDPSTGLFVKNNENYNTLKKLAKRLIDIINVKSMNESIVIVLPSDNLVRHSSLMGQNKVLAANIHDKYHKGATYNEEDIKEVTKTSGIIPILSSDFVKKESSSPSFYHLVKTYSPHLKKLSVLLRIMAIEKATSEYDNADIDEYQEDFDAMPGSGSVSAGQSLVKDEQETREILVNVISVDGTYIRSVQLPVKIPAIVQVDKELALEFARNLVEKLFIEYQGDADDLDQPGKLNPELFELKVNDDQI